MELHFAIVLLHILLRSGAGGTAADGGALGAQSDAARADPPTPDLNRPNRQINEQKPMAGALTATGQNQGSSDGVMGVELAQCAGKTVESILTRMAGGGVEGCQARPTVIPLPQPQAQFSHVTPTHFQVNRCSGSCMNSHYTCIPVKTRQVRVPVMLSLRTASPGPEPTLCAQTEVEEHVECECGCKVTPDQCHPELQEYLDSECRCTCRDHAARDKCLEQGWFWDQDVCACVCPNMPYPTCPSGYVFDKLQTCKCKYSGSSAFIEFVVVIVSIASMAFILALVHCHKKKIGFFRERDAEGDAARYRTSSFMVHVRTLSDRLDSTASRIRVPSGGNSVWGDNGRTVKVVGISRIRSAGSGGGGGTSNNRRLQYHHHRGECCRGGCGFDSDAEELVQLNTAAEATAGRSEEEEEEEIETTTTATIAADVKSSTVTSKPQRQAAAPAPISMRPQRQDLFLESDDDDDAVKPYRTFTV